jgi:hypothetical protein
MTSKKISVRALAGKFQIGKTQTTNIITYKQKGEFLQKWNSNEYVTQKPVFFFQNERI